MKRLWMGLVGTAFALVAFAVAFVPAAASGSNAPVTIKWNTQALVSMSLTPNYFSGFGQVKAVFGAQPVPTHGPNAGPGIGQGDIDFGNILSGTNYLYKYAAHVSVSTNDPGGFKLYGEGAANFYNTTDGTSQPIASSLFYVSSTSGSPADANNGFTPGLPFQNTSGIVTPAQPNPAATPAINYGGTYPSSPVASSLASTGDFYYDYLLKVPPIATQGQYFVWIVYTVVPQ